MKSSHILPFLLLIALCHTACTRKGNGNNNTADSLSTDTLIFRELGSECTDLGPGQFCAFGLDILQLGDSLTWNENIRPSLEGAVLKDTVFEEIRSAGPNTDTVAWFVKMMSFGDGKVLMEADFETGHLLNRIRIESAKYAHPSGMRVGSSGKELKAFATEAVVLPFPAYQVMEVILNYRGSRLIFHVPMEGIYKENKVNYKLSDIPDDVRVIRIVIM